MEMTFPVDNPVYCYTAYDCDDGPKHIVHNIFIQQTCQHNRNYKYMCISSGSET